MKVAVVGCGNISRVHFKAIEHNPSLELVAVADIKLDRAQSSAEEYGVNAYGSLDELLANETVDCVHICTPHYIHTPLAITALDRGINVLTEKPCSMTLEQLEQLRAAQKRSGKAVGVCFQNRYNECVKYVRRVIASGELGAPLSIRAFVTWSRGRDYYSDDWHGTLAKEGGGLLINQSIHTLDLMRCFGGNCRSVTAHISNDHLQGVIEVEDTASILFEFENVGKAVFYGTTAYGDNSPVLIEIGFESSKLRLEGDRLYKIESNGDISEIVQSQNGKLIGKDYWGTGHGALINDFYDCIARGTAFEIDSFEGGEALKMVLAAYESSACGERRELS